MNLLTSYIRGSLRQARNRPIETILVLLSLAMGMAVTLLLGNYVRFELSFDKYHVHADRIARVTLVRNAGEGVIDWARTPSPLGPTLAENFGGIQSVVRVRKNPRTDLVRYEDREFYESGVYFVDASVFDVFDFQLVRGDESSALIEPNSILLTPKIVDKYFGAQDPLGSQLTLENKVTYTVTGIVEEPPASSHFRFDFLASFESLRALLGESRIESWAWVDVHTYVLLNESMSLQNVRARSDDFVRDFTPESFSTQTKLNFQPLTSIHLHSNIKDEISQNSSMSYVYILASLAVVILFVSTFNFVNLTTAAYGARAREIAIRQVVGAGRRALVGQVFSEMIFQVAAAVIAGILLALFLLPVMGELSGHTFSIRNSVPTFLLIGFIAIPIVSITAGLYPILLLSRQDPVVGIRGTWSARSGGGRLRGALIVGQFAVTAVFLIAMSVASDQVEYMTSNRIGFDAEEVIIIPLRDTEQRRASESVKQRLLQEAFVKSVTTSSSTPGNGNYLTLSLRPEGTTEAVPIATFLVDFDFLDAYKLEIQEGRDFIKGNPADSSGAIIINEAAVRFFALDEPVGTPAEAFGSSVTIVGVVKDFQASSLHEAVPPVVIAPRSFYRYLSVRIETGNLTQSLARLESAWKEMFAERPFEYTFLDQELNARYTTEVRLGSIFKALGILVALIAGLGLLGFVSHSSRLRQHEIGVRKVLGATEFQILRKAVSTNLRLIIWGLVIGIPLAYVASSIWLEEFAFRTTANPIHAVTTGIVLLVLGLITVSFHSIRSAKTSPARVLRDA